MIPPRHRSSAWPLAWAWIALVVYASLHPFSGWHWPDGGEGRDALALLWLPLVRASRFDQWTNFVAYLPLGSLLTIGWQRIGRGALAAAALATLTGLLLSLLMEWTQILLPIRVPSRLDLAYNGLGALVGALLGAALGALGMLDRWQAWRDRWFVPHGTTGLTLLVTWPIALLFPPPLPMGLGEGLLRAAQGLHAGLDGTPLASWLPAPQPQGPLAPGLEWLVIVLGLLAPCWVAFAMSRHWLHRWILLLGALLLGLAATSLSTLLNFGPEHAAAWLTPVMPPALGGALIAGSALALLPRRLSAAVGLIGITSLIALVTQAGTDPYFASSLQAWEQGRFVRFHGVAQWVGWLWPFAALGFLLLQVVGRADAGASPRR